MVNIDRAIIGIFQVFKIKGRYVINNKLNPK